MFVFHKNMFINPAIKENNKIKLNSQELYSVLNTLRLDISNTANAFLLFKCNLVKDNNTAMLLIIFLNKTQNIKSFRLDNLVNRQSNNHYLGLYHNILNKIKIKSNKVLFSLSNSVDFISNNNKTPNTIINNSSSMNKYLSTNSHNNIELQFLRKNRVFNKGRYSRCRQNYRTGVYLCMYLSVVCIFGLYF